MNDIPLHVEQRRAICRECPYAGRRDHGGAWVVTLNSRCMRVAEVPTLREMVENPDRACPDGRFKRAVADPRGGRLVVRDGRVAGWTPVLAIGAAVGRPAGAGGVVPPPAPGRPCGRPCGGGGHQAVPG